MITGVARTVAAEAVICGVDAPALVLELIEIAGDLRVVAATPNAETYATLVSLGCDTLKLSVQSMDKYKQGRYTVSIALESGEVAPGDVVVCAIGHGLCRGDADIILVTDLEAGTLDVALSDLVKLTDGIRPTVLEATLHVACMIGAASRGGKPVGAAFVVGDSSEVLKRSKQLILNPFAGHEEYDRMLVRSETHEMLMELAKLDGAFVVRGDGLVRTAGTFLGASDVEVEIAPGLGARHVAAAAMTAATTATAVVVSATDGFVRAFSGGELVLQMDPDLSLLPLRDATGDRSSG
jgi:DNA integrity scanning protein DisA with diadenylate cyclase activity